VVLVGYVKDFAILAPRCGRGLPFSYVWFEILIFASSFRCWSSYVDYVVCLTVVHLGALYLIWLKGEPPRSCLPPGALPATGRMPTKWLITVGCCQRYAVPAQSLACACSPRPHLTWP